MTDLPPTNLAPAPTGGRSVIFTFDDLGRILSQREAYPVSAAAEGPAQNHYDEHGRLVRVAQAFHETLINPCTP